MGVVLENRGLMFCYGWDGFRKTDGNADCDGERNYQRGVVVVPRERERANDFPGAFGFPEKLQGRKFCPELVGLNPDMWRNRYQGITGATVGEGF